MLAQSTAKPKKTKYEIKDWIEIYSSWNHLLKPEEVVLQKLKPVLPTMRMLDIGVGGGRTTHFFCDAVREYVGIDFDDNMIEACRKKFPQRSGKVSFHTCDARSIEMFEDGSFDFVLFSFNGMDYLPWEDRPKAFREILRVGKRGGYFLFSTHNLNSVERLFSLRQITDTRSFFREWKRYFLLRLRNEDANKLKARDHAQIYDGVYSKKLRWLIPSLFRKMGFFWYTRPELQVQQLNDLGFRNIILYTVDGREFRDVAEAGASKDYWVHYFCEM